MSTKSRTITPWHFAIVCMGVMIALAACGVRGGTTTVTPATPVPTKAPSLRLREGAVEMQNDKNAWVPIAGQTTFELVGKLESTDPWMVTHNTFASRAFTQVADGLEIGNTVRVKGIILEDATWLATSIEAEDGPLAPALKLVGKVDSVEPWVISGIKLDVTDDTAITGKIAPDMIARVAAFLWGDGTWKIFSLAPLSNFTEIPGCTVVTATVASAQGHEVQFTGWPMLWLGEDVRIENEAGEQTTLSMNRQVLVVACPTGGQFMITKILVLRQSSGTSVNERYWYVTSPIKKTDMP